jgi:bla regulator protein BlaR1
MLNWILAQQLVLSLCLTLVLVAEKKALTTLGAKGLYITWLILPLALLANNLPKDLVPLNDAVLYQYLVKINQQTQGAGSLLYWQIVWLTGVITLVLLTIQAQWKIHRGQLTLVEHSQLPSAMPKGLKVVESNLITSPSMVGIWPGKLILPNDFKDKFSRVQQQLILQHELVHYRRLDNLSNLLAMVLVAIFWFNPLVWLAYGAFRRSQELACDATVLANKTPDEKLSYSKALLLCVQTSVPTLSIYSQYGAQNPMLLRIKLIKNQIIVKKTSIFIGLISGFGLLAGIAMANQQGNVMHASKANDATPITRIEPKYPVAAAQQNIEGSVLLQFDITQDGSTANIKVIKAEPEQTFDKVAIKALEQWRYKPQIIGGQAHSQANLLVQLDFRMDENPSLIRPMIEGIKVLN